MTSCMCKSCLVLPVKEEFAQFATIIAFGLFCFYFFDGIKKLNWVSSELNPYYRIRHAKKNCSCFVMCRRSCLPVVLSCSRKAGGYSISWREFSSILRLFEHLLPWVFDYPCELSLDLANCRANAAKNRSKAQRYFKENRARHSLTWALQVSSAGPAVLLAPSCGLR